MRTKCLLLAAGLFAVGSLLAPTGATAQDDLTERLAGIEQRMWKGWAEGDVTPLQHHATEGYISVGDWGMVVGRDAIIELTAAHLCDVKSYELDDWQLHRLSDETAVLTYEAEQDAVCDGTPVAPEVMVSAVYVMEDGEWKAGSYHETPIAEDNEDADDEGEDDEEHEDEDHEDDDGR